MEAAEPSLVSHLYCSVPVAFRQAITSKHVLPVTTAVTACHHVSPCVFFCDSYTILRCLASDQVNSSDDTSRNLAFD